MDYVLIPGAGGRAWYWHVIAARLIDRGHLVSAVELPADDDSKGRPDNAQAVLNAVGNSSGVVIVAASLGAFTAALVVEPLKPAAVVLVNPMIPRSGETPGAWWGNTGAIEARHVHVAVRLPSRARPEDLHGARRATGGSSHRHRHRHRQG